MDILITAILGGLILWLLYYVSTLNAKYWKGRNFPVLDEGPTKLLWDLKNLVFPKKSFDDIFLDLYEKTEGLKVCGVDLFLKPQVLIRDPETAYNVMIKDFSHFYDRPFPIDEKSDPLSGHLFALKGDRWRALRYKLAPTFTSGKLKFMFSAMTEGADEILEYLAGKTGQAIEIKRLLSCFTLNVIGSVAFGMKVDAHKYLDSGELNEFVEKAQRFFRPSKKQFLKFILITLSPKMAKALNLTFADAEMNEFFLRVVKDTVKFRQETGTKRNDFLQLLINIKAKDENSNDTGKLEDKTEGHPSEDVQDIHDKELLDNLEQVKNSDQFKFTDNTLAANSFVFISGGSETLATTLNFAFYELAVNPEVQRRAQDEIDGILAGGQEFDYAALNAMVYLENIVSETLRKHPPLANLVRQCMQDYKVPGTDYVIKKGEEIVIPVIGFHRDPEIFPDPDTFDPDRFVNANDIPKGAYMPFGIGPRFCIAMRFAQLEVKVFLAKTLMKFNIKLSPKTKVPIKLMKNVFSKQIEGGLWIEFEKRN